MTQLSTGTPSTDRSWHPVDPLIAEHEVILGVLDAGERRALAERAHDVPFARGFWLDFALFLRCYADELHHGKEEALLFPALTRCGLPEHGGPIAVMRSEHDEGRGLVYGLRRAAEDEEEAATWQHALLFVSLLRQHIAKENQILFEMARQLLSQPEVAGLQWAYEEFETGFEREHAKRGFLALAESLAAQV